MRPALQRLLGSPSALTILRNVVKSPDYLFTCQSCRASSTRLSNSQACLSERRAPEAGGGSQQVLSLVTKEFAKRRRAAQADIKKALRVEPWTNQEVQERQKAHTHIISPGPGAASVVRKEQYDGRLNEVDEIKSSSKARFSEERASGAGGVSEQILDFVTGELKKRRLAAQADIKKALRVKPLTDREVQEHHKTQTYVVSPGTGSPSVVRKQQHGGRFNKVDETKEKPTHRKKVLSSNKDLHQSSSTRAGTSGKEFREEEDLDHKGLPQQHNNNTNSGGRSDIIRKVKLKLAFHKQCYDILEKRPEEGTGASPKYKNHLGSEREPAIRIRRYELNGLPPIENGIIWEGVHKVRHLDLQYLESSSEEDGVIDTGVPLIDLIKEDHPTAKVKTLGEDGNNIGVDTTIETVQDREHDDQNLQEASNHIHMTRLTTDIEAKTLGDFEARSTLALCEEGTIQEVPSQTDIGSTDLVSSTIASSHAVPVHRIHWRSVLVDSETSDSRRPSDSSGDTIISPFRKLACDFESWCQSARSRRLSAKRSNGILNIWRHSLMYTKDLPTEGRLTDEFWECLLEFGFSNQKRLNEIITYAIALQKRTGRSWERLYSTIIMHCLKRQANSAMSWHDTLYPMVQPTREQFIALVEYAHRSAPGSVVELQKIYEKLSLRDLYSPIMQHLYQQEWFLAAANWHDVFIACWDLPEDPHVYKPLFRYIVLFGSQRRLASMVNKMLEQQIPLPSFINRPMPLNPVSRETLDQQLAATHGIPANTVGDDFHARLFATNWFSTETVIAILRMLGTETIGSASLRELAIKERSDPQAIRARLNQLREAGIALTNSIFCKLVEKLCEEENSRVLENVVKCDLHPDTFEDQDLQESLLGTYHASGQQLQFDRTLSILLVNCPENYHTTYYWNLHLRLHLKQKDLPSVMRTLQTMQAFQLPLAIKSTSYVRICLLARRRVGMRPRTTKELFIIINIWQSVLRSGSTMPAHVWVEILKRLGMTGQLEEYEKLALWLADWYSSSPARAYLGGLLKRSRGLTITRSIDVPTRIQAYHRNHPLNILFPAPAQQAIIAWGFQHSRIGGPGWRWGLYMLLKLKQRKVSIERETVAKACRLRLISLFGKGRSNRLINRRERARNAAQLKYYVEEMEKIGGKGLVRPLGWQETTSTTSEQTGRWMR